jgi:predicted  nucleic acid-binding Zn-ribbon protein
MNRDLLLQMLAERMAEDHSADIKPNAFLVIMKTIHNILDHEEKTTSQLETIVSKQNSFEIAFREMQQNQITILSMLGEISSNNSKIAYLVDKINEDQKAAENLIKDFQAKLDESNDKVIELSDKIENLESSNENLKTHLNENFETTISQISILTSNDGKWKSFWKHVIIFITAAFTVFEIANSLNLFNWPWAK